MSSLKNHDLDNNKIWGVIFKKLLMTNKWLIRKGQPSWFIVDWNLKKSTILGRRTRKCCLVLKSLKLSGVFLQNCVRKFFQKNSFKKCTFFHFLFHSEPPWSRVLIRSYLILNLPRGTWTRIHLNTDAVK